MKSFVAVLKARFSNLLVDVWSRSRLTFLPKSSFSVITTLFTKD